VRRWTSGLKCAFVHSCR